MNIKRLILVTSCCAAFCQQTSAISINISGWASAIKQAAVSAKNFVNSGTTESIARITGGILKHINKNKFGYAGLALGVTALILAYRVTSNQQEHIDALQKNILLLGKKTEDHDTIFSATGWDHPTEKLTKIMTIAAKKQVEDAKKQETQFLSTAQPLLATMTTRMADLTAQATAINQRIEDLNVIAHAGNSQAVVPYSLDAQACRTSSFRSGDYNE